MNPITAVFVRTSRSIRRAVISVLDRLTRKASLKLAVSVSLPPFLKFSLDYRADLSKPEKRVQRSANDNNRRRSSRRPA
jgi:hypothetical protein